MQRTLKYALATVMASVMVAPALAQDNFPDVPDNHWAFEALARLKKDGILVGYPDGKYRGSRPASRYELAVAIHAAYVNLKNITDGLQAQIDELKRNPGNTDVQSLRDAITALQNDVAGLKGLGQDVADLRRLVNEFQKPLMQLGVDVEEMKRSLADINDRVSALERRKPAIDITGDASLFIIGGNRTNSGEFAIGTDGRILGIDALGNTQNFLRDFKVFHEAGLTFTTTKETGPRARGTVVFGNILDNDPGVFPAGGGYNQGRVYGGALVNEAATSFYVQELAVTLGGKALGAPISADLGRIGYKVSPYLYQRPDTTPYFDNERWDNGKWIMDGAVVGLNFSGVNLDIFGGRNSRRLASNGAEIQGNFAGTYGSNNSVYGSNVSGFGNPFGQFQIDRNFGVNLKAGFSGVNLNVAYLLLESDLGYTGAPANNRITAYGVGLDTSLAGVKVGGSYNKTNLQNGSTVLNSTNNAAWNINLGYAREKFGIEGGYRRIESRYVAPGDWGRLGLVYNPVNIEGFNVKGYFNVNNALVLRAGAEFDRGAQNVDPNTGFDRDTRIDHFNVGLDFRLGPATTVMLGYEDTRFRNLVGVVGDSKYRWLTLGVGYGFTDSTKLRLQYQMSDIENDFQLLGGGLFGSRQRGGIISSTLSVKF